MSVMAISLASVPSRPAIFWSIASTAWVPGAQGKTVTEGGKPAAEAEGVTFLRYEGGAAVYELAAGTYRFKVEKD